MMRFQTKIHLKSINIRFNKYYCTQNAEMHPDII